MESNKFNTIVLTLCLGFLSPTVLAASFQGLGDLTGGIFQSQAFGVSADGSTVVGASFSASGAEAFRWTQADGIVGLGDLAGGGSVSVAKGISADGYTVVGGGTDTSGMRAISWTQTGGMINLGTINNDSTATSTAHAASADGKVVIGTNTTSDGTRSGFRWTQAGGMVDLGYLPNYNQYNQAYDVSADGSVVVGTVCNGRTGGNCEIYRWAQAGGMVGIGGNAMVNASAISADGGTIVGIATGGEAFRWTQAGGMERLGDLSGGSFYSYAFDVSANGNTVVGSGNTVLGEEAFVWDATNGMRSIKDILLLHGLDLSGWTLSRSTAVSADGGTIVGYGQHNGKTEAWIASFDSPFDVPEPSSMIYWLVAFILGLTRFRNVYGFSASRIV